MFVALCIHGKGSGANYVRVDSKSGVVVKRFVWGKRNPYVDLNGEDSFLLEYSILKRFNETRSQCKNTHVPHLLWGNIANLELATSWGGHSLSTSLGAKLFCEIPLTDALVQGDCIDKQLKAARVAHHDLAPKQVVVNEAKKVTLVDYDIAVLDDTPKFTTESFLRSPVHVGSFKTRRIYHALNLYHKQLCS